MNDFFLDATMLTLPVEAHLSAFSFLWDLSFQICIEPIYSSSLYYAHMVLLLGITVVGSDN